MQSLARLGTWETLIPGGFFFGGTPPPRRYEEKLVLDKTFPTHVAHNTFTHNVPIA